jgi:hypothetical protein
VGTWNHCGNRNHPWQDHEEGVMATNRGVRNAELIWLPARADLHEVPLEVTLARLWQRRAGVVITMSIGQWDSFLAAGYAQGCVLLELDDDEYPIRAYQRPEAERDVAMTRH